MKIPVFVSVGSKLSPEQIKIRDNIFGVMAEMNLEERTVGRSDYPVAHPTREVIVLAKHCAGALILGFPEYHFDKGERANPPGANEPFTSLVDTYWSTPWNQIEAGVCATLGLPMLIFRDPKLQSEMNGIFEQGATSLFIQDMPTLDKWEIRRNTMREVLYNWRSEIHSYYYGVHK